MSLTAEQRQVIEDAFRAFDIEPGGTLPAFHLQTFAERKHGWAIEQVNAAVANALDDDFIEAVPGPPAGYKLVL